MILNEGIFCETALSSPGWLKKVQSNINKIKHHIEPENIDESYLAEDIYINLEPGTHFRVNDANRSVYTITSIREEENGDWAVFSSRHKFPTIYAVLLSDLQRALVDRRIKILSEDEINTLKLRKDNTDY